MKGVPKAIEIVLRLSMMTDPKEGGKGEIDFELPDKDALKRIRRRLAQYIEDMG